MDNNKHDLWKFQLKSLVSGGIGGVCLVAVGHPFDLIKVKLQTEHHASMMDVLRGVLRERGMRGLYRGVSAPLIGVTPIFAVCFWGYDIGLRMIDNARPNSGDTGAFSALPTTLIMAPVERVKIVMQTDAERRKFAPALGRVWGEGGLVSLYRGSMATLARDVPGSLAYFGGYEACKHVTGSVLLSGGMAGIANWLVACPADVVKSRFQAAPPGTYSSASDALVKLLQAEGVGSLFKGIGPLLLRAFPANAACFYGRETSKQVLDTLLQ